MHWIWAAATSLGFLNLANKIDFALAYPSQSSHFGNEKFLQIGKLTYQFLFRIDSKIGTNPHVYPQN